MCDPHILNRGPLVHVPRSIVWRLQFGRGLDTLRRSRAVINQEVFGLEFRRAGVGSIA
jgi:hypothetical protein